MQVENFNRVMSATADPEDVVVTCPHCNRKNRVRKADVANAMCGSCHLSLLVESVGGARQAHTKRCPYCAADIPVEAIKCKHCGEWLVERPREHHASNVQRTFHLTILSLFTFGIYEVYWFYRTWKQFGIHRNLPTKPGWKTLGLIVPVLNIILVYELFRDIRDWANRVGVHSYSAPGWLVAGYALLNGASARAFGVFGSTSDAAFELGILTSATVLLGLGVWMLAIVQNTLNACWRKEQPGWIERSSLTMWEILLVVGGLIVLILMVVSTIGSGSPLSLL